MPFSWPGSTRRKDEEPANPYELTFRDGKRELAPYLVELMVGIDTVRYTYDEAIALMNNRLVVDHLNSALSDRVRQHLGDGR